MKSNQLIIIIILLYSIVQILFPIKLGEGALLPFFSLIVSIILIRYSTFKSFEAKHKFFILIFLYLSLSVNVFLATESTGALLGKNFSYFLKLTIIPSVIYLMLSVPIYLVACKNKTFELLGVSSYILIYSVFVSCAIFMSGLLWALSHHSV